MEERSIVQRYRVGSSPTSSTVSIYHLKLTDSSLKALEEFQKIKNQSKGQFHIKVNSNHGEVDVPTISGTRQFKFSVSGVAVDPLSSFECLSESKKRMTAIGPMSKKLTVHATDDVYKTTKEKMALAEEESKKNCIKVIKQGGSGEDPFVRKPSRPSSFAPSKGSKSGFPAKPQKPFVNQGSKHNSSGPKSRYGVQVEPQSVSSPVEARSTLSAKSLSSGNSSTVKPLGNSSIANYPYRDRIIHLLAVRPYKKLELQQILERDGGSEREKQSWTTVLNQVAVFNPHDNSYSLSQSHYNDVKVDWPFYAEETRKEVKRKLSQIKEGLRSTSVSPISSPSSAASSTNSPTEAVKRFAPEDQYSVPSKKQRVAHAQKTSMQDTTPSLTPQVENGKPDAISGAVPVTTKPSKPENKASSALEFQGQENVYVSTDDSSDCLRAYVPIMSAEQRHNYKADFYKEYSEYQALYKQITERIDIFKKLYEQFENSQGFSRESVRNQIFSEYDKLQQEKGYAVQRTRYMHLERKLKHIKRLVQDFDRKQLNALS